MIIYVATNTINGKQYVGQTTVHFENRQKQHLYQASHESNLCYFHRALRKYGANNFEWEIIGQCNNIDELNEKEKYYIDKLGSFVDKNPGGYNCSTGGSNFLLSEETRAKMSASQTGREHSEETKAKIRANGNIGKKFSEDTRAKMSASKTGKKHSEETKAKMSASHTGELNHRYGKKHSEETKAKMRANGNIGKKFSEETRAKMSAYWTGKKHIKVTCPHCEKIGSKPTMARWHFDNCKFKGEKIMKLYDVPRHSKIRIIDEDVKNPPAALVQDTGDVLDFDHIDGMYSLCYDKDGNSVHIAAWTEVEVLDE